MQVKKIVSTWLHSSNLERTKEFMLKLGLSVIAENEKLIIFTYPEGGPNTAYYLYPEPLNDDKPMRKGGAFAIEVDDIAAFLKHCKENEMIEQDAEVHAQESFISFILKDPDENIFEIIQPLV